MVIKLKTFDRTYHVLCKFTAQVVGVEGWETVRDSYVICVT